MSIIARAAFLPVAIVDETFDAPVTRSPPANTRGRLSSYVTQSAATGVVLAHVDARAPQRFFDIRPLADGGMMLSHGTMRVSPVETGRRRPSEAEVTERRAHQFDAGDAPRARR